jgi:hypothetical protein
MQVAQKSRTRGESGLKRALNRARDESGPNVNVPTLTHDRGSDLHRNVTRFMTSTTVHFYTVLKNETKLRWLRADSGGRLFDERPVTLTRVGTLSFLGCCRCEPLCDGTYFPRGMSFALRVKGCLPLCHQKKAGRECTILRPAVG